MLWSKIRVGTLPMPDSSLFNIFETRVTSLLFYFTGQVIVSIWESQERTNPWVFSFILDWTKNKNHILHSNNLCGLFGRSCGSGGLTGVGFGINSQVRLWRVKEKLEMGGVARASPLAFRLCKTGVALAERVTEDPPTCQGIFEEPAPGGAGFFFKGHQPLQWQLKTGHLGTHRHLQTKEGRQGQRYWQETHEKRPKKEGKSQVTPLRFN